MPTRITYCRICEAACGLLADVEAGRVVQLRPDKDHVASTGFACAKGTRFAEVHQSSARVNHPLVRRGATLQRADWRETLSDIGQRVQRIRAEHGPHAVGVYLGNPTAFSYTMPVYGAGFVRALGTRNYFSAGSLDCNNKFVVAKRMLGSAGTHPVPDVDRAQFALLIGTNPSVSQSSFISAPRFVERLKAIEARGGRVVIVDPRRTETARMVGQHVPIVPDTDAALLLSLLHVVFKEGLEDRRCLDAHASGLAELRDAVADFEPERVSVRTRVPVENIYDLARAFARADGAFCHLSTGVNQGSFGNIAYAAKIALELVTGNLDREGGARLPRGAADTAWLAKQLGLDDEPSFKSRIGGFSPVLGTMPTAILADEILAPGSEQIRALFVVAGNPLLSAPDGDRLREAFEQLELLVVIDLFVNDTGTCASHVLPTTDFLEREDFPLAHLQLMPHSFVQWTDAVVEPKAERRPEWRILVDLAKACGVPMFGSRAADLALRAALKIDGPKALSLPLFVPSLGARPLSRLRRFPHGISLEHRERPGDFLKRRIRTPDRRVQLFPHDVYARLPELQSSLSTPPGDDHTLSLITKRERLGHNSWMHENAALTTPEHAAWFSRSDAERLGLSDGDRVRLEASGRAVELPARITDDLIAGSVAVPHGYGHEPDSSWQLAVRRGGQNINRLAESGPGAVDPLSGMCRFVGLPVRVTRLAASAAERAAE